MYRLFISGVTGKEKASQSLYSNNLAFSEQPAGSSNSILLRDRLAFAVDQLQTGSAAGTGIRLGMEAAVQGVVILMLALRTHGEVTHGGHGTVVRNIFNDGKAGTAVGAVGKGVAVAAVFRRHNFFKAGGAGGNIRRNELVFVRFRDAVADFKSLVAVDWLAGGGDAFNAGDGRCHCFHLNKEAVQRRSPALNLNPDFT